MENYVKWCAMADDANADIETLVKVWVRDHSGGELTATAILEMAQKLNIFPKVFAKATDHGRVLSLSAHVLTPMIDRPVCGWAVQRTESGSNSKYFLRNIDILQMHPCANFIKYINCFVRQQAISHIAIT